METLAFSMAGAPRGQGRPRATAKRGFATVYKAGVDRKYENSVKAVAQVAMAGAAPFAGALSVSLRFRMAVPKSTPKYLRAAYLSGESAYFGAFDVDNLAKSILDACNKTVWADDKQITRLFVTKVAAEQPGVDVKVEAFEPQGGDA